MARIWDSDEFMDTWWAWMLLGAVAVFIAGYGCATGALVLAVTLLVVAICCFLRARSMHEQDLERVRARARATARFQR